MIAIDRSPIRRQARAMSYAKALSVGLVGVTGHVVEVEADLAAGIPMLTLTGLPDTALNEARDRVRAAVVNAGESWPSKRITINLLPATLPKHGSGFDIAIAASLLIGSGRMRSDRMAGIVLIGELGLDGSVRPVRGILPALVAAHRAGLTRAIVPAANAAEAALIPAMAVRGVDTLRALIDFANGGADLITPQAGAIPPLPPGPDLADLIGQELGRRALEVAAAGGHHLFLIGPPGAGKTMLAQRLPTVLPPLSDEEAIEVTAVHSIAGTLPPGAPMIRRPPFQAPHHTASAAALVGGGPGVARPGAVSLAHHGVLFLDEAPEFPARVLETLRQPLELGVVTIDRARATATYPARIQLVLAANPCPCAKPLGDAHCECSSVVRRRYLARLSGPLLDRVDLRVRLDAVSAAQLLAEGPLGEASAGMLRRVVAARAAAAHRWSAAGHRTNSEVTGVELRAPAVRLPRAVTAQLTRHVDAGLLSARGYDRVLRMAWTISDLDGRDRPCEADIAEAVFLRGGGH